MPVSDFTHEQLLVSGARGSARASRSVSHAERVEQGRKGGATSTVRASVRERCECGMMTLTKAIHTLHRCRFSLVPF